MTVQGFRSWLLTRITGAFLLWVISLSVAAGYACAPLLDAGSPLLADSGNGTLQSQSAPDACSEHPPDTQGSVSKPLADASHGLDVDGASSYGTLGRAAFGSPSITSVLTSRHRMSAGSQPVYLATARLRL
ncbi:hypothetical protein [Aquisalimonas asiatica]|uniref:Uncharacterized protein n=1 Tax=Aquisalimonas asiatica TaxID=406100 RepID=A0A1H8T125_9GAMM|nr:hypothetical protein [Aquisalimonas asiatica]SEO84486.1 hypothetical protein SAMN04488052_103334 [Aquisalimonas asiatica]